ncbi:MAG TPA: substrate-binding domain-containing protein, partial [Ilumatobacter sp.]
MRSRTLRIIGAAVLALTTVAACGGDDDAESSAATEAPSTEAPATAAPATEAPSTEAPATDPSEAAPVKVAFVTKFQVEFFTAMEDAAKAYAEANEGIEIEYFSCASPSDVDCQIAQIEDAVVKGFDAMVITPMGNEVIPALDAAADSGLVVVLADNDLADFTKKTAVAATDNVVGGQLAGEYLTSVLEEGDTIGLME